MIIKIHFLCSIFPGMRWAIGRRKLTDLQKTTMTTFFKWCPPEAYIYGGRRSDSDKILRYNNGSEIIWIHLDDEESATLIGGLEINGFLLDQAEEIEEWVFEKLLGRLGRWDKATISPEILEWFAIENPGKPWPWVNPDTGIHEVPGYALLTCNPDAESHWLYRRFHPDSPEHHERRGTEEEPVPSFADQGYRMLFMDSSKNKFLSRENLRVMMSNDASFVRRYVRGQWGIPEGQIHDISKLSKIEYKPEIIEYLTNHCVLMRVLDHGDSSPTCCLWVAIDQDGNLIYYREYYKPLALITDHRLAITAKSNNERYTFNIADPQIFYKTMQKHGGMWSVADEYADTTHHSPITALYFTPGDNDELSTRDRINSYLRVDPEHIHPFTREKGSPRIFFIEKSDAYPDGCYHVIRETQAQRRKKIGTDLGKPIFADEREEKVKDHAYDPLRYSVAAHAPASTEAKKAANPNSFNNVRAKFIAKIRKAGIRTMAQKARSRR